VKLVVALLLLCRCLAAQGTASVAGTVIDSETKQPMAGVHVAIYVSPMGGDEQPVYGAVSKPDGHFSVTGLSPATYFVNARHTGYVFAPSKILSVPLKAGDNKTDLVVAMTQRAVISGRVTDEFGDPVQEVRVEGELVEPARRVITIGPMSAQTDDRGEFRLSGAPGKFLICAQTWKPNRGPSVYGPTWYPASESKEHATAIVATAGREITGIEIRLVAHRSISLSGLVTGLPADPQPAFVSIWSATSGPHRGSAETGKDGQFTMTDLTEGNYQIQAFYGDSLRSAVVDVQLAGGDRSGVQLALVPGEELYGTVEPADSSKLTVFLEGPMGNAVAAVSPEGKFRFDAVFPGKYSVVIRPMPENAYIKSVKLDNTEITDGDVDFSHGAGSSKLKIALSPNGATVTGSIEPADAALAFVILERSAGDTRSYNSGPVLPGAKFSLSGIAPGKYRPFAVDVSTMGGGPDALKPLFEKGEPIEIHEGDRVMKNAKLLAQP